MKTFKELNVGQIFEYQGYDCKNISCMKIRSTPMGNAVIISSYPDHNGEFIHLLDESIVFVMSIDIY